MSTSTAPAVRSHKVDFTLSTTLLPSHYPALASIHLRAFADTRVRQLMVPPGPSAPSFEDMVASNIHNRRKDQLLPDPSLINLVALSSDGTVLGLAQWFSPVDRTSTGGAPLEEDDKREEEAGRMYADARAVEGEEGDAWRRGEAVVKNVRKGYDMGFLSAYGAKLDVGVREWAKGRGVWFLQLIIVDPDYQGHGIGSALLDWGVQRAKEDGVPVWLDAVSPEGTALYMSRGFRVVCWNELEDKDSPDGVYRWPGMALGDFEEK